MSGGQRERAQRRTPGHLGHHSVQHRDKTHPVDRMELGDRVPSLLVTTSPRTMRASRRIAARPICKPGRSCCWRLNLHAVDAARTHRWGGAAVPRSLARPCRPCGRLPGSAYPAVAAAACTMSWRPRARSAGSHVRCTDCDTPISGNTAGPAGSGGAVNPPAETIDIRFRSRHQAAARSLILRWVDDRRPRCTSTGCLSPRPSCGHLGAQARSRSASCGVRTTRAPGAPATGGAATLNTWARRARRLRRRRRLVRDVSRETMRGTHINAQAAGQRIRERGGTVTVF